MENNNNQTTFFSPTVRRINISVNICAGLLIILSVVFGILGYKVPLYVCLSLIALIAIYLSVIRLIKYKRYFKTILTQSDNVQLENTQLQKRYYITRVVQEIISNLLLFALLVLLAIGDAEQRLYSILLYIVLGAMIISFATFALIKHDIKNTLKSKYQIDTKVLDNFDY